MVTDSVANLQATFSDRLRGRAAEIGSWLCIGLDPQTDSLPAGIARDARGLVEFCDRIVRATRDYALCYKINFAFFEALGSGGWIALEETRRTIPSDIAVIADAKRGDIASTMSQYARAIFERMDFDAVTLNPFLGWDALEPFLDYPGRAAFILSRTSNPGAGHFQELSTDGIPLYLRVAAEAAAMSRPTEAGVVAGATDLGALHEVRAIDENLLLLVPGVGAQGGSASAAHRIASNGRGENALITMSRSILYASPGEDFENAAAAAARDAAAQTRLGPQS